MAHCIWGPVHQLTFRTHFRKCTEGPPPSKLGQRRNVRNLTLLFIMNSESADAEEDEEQADYASGDFGSLPQ